MATLLTNADLQKKIVAAGANPASIMQVSIDYVEAGSDGTVSFVDASNPAVSLFETSAVVHSASVLQHTAALRKIYPSLAQTPDELYNHMSYRDYLNRFASPSTDPFIYLVSLSQFMQQMVPVAGTNYSKVTIPRGTRITVNDYVSFTLQFPIDIKYFGTQSLEVAYDTSVGSPLQSLSTNIIVSDLVQDPTSQEKWIRFTAPSPQVKVSKTTDNVQMGKYFIRDIEFTDQYCLARAYYRNPTTGVWVEMQTTHSPSVYDPTVPTMQLKVIGNVLNVSLPLIYQNNGMVIGDIRIDVYTTKGAEIINLEEYPIESYVLDMNPLDPTVDTSEYTAAALNVSLRCRSLSIMSGGKNALTFEQLRARVIDNSLGPQDVPITNINIKAAAENAGFELVPNVDVVTNRIFLATRKLPKPSDSQLVTSANIGISTYITDDPSAINHDWVRVHGRRTTFLSKNLYQSQNGVIRLLSRSEVEDLLHMDSVAKLSMVNGNQYLYTPFYYVLDTSSLELQIRAYHLDAPTASDLNFVSQNTTLQLVVNTAAYQLTKVDTGYKLRIQTRSGNLYKQLQDSEVMAQLSVLIPRSTRYAYWSGVLVGRTDDGERVFEFNINTDYDINEDDLITLINGKIDSPNDAPVDVGLASAFNIFHITTSITSLYRPSTMDDIIAKFLISSPCAAITREQLKLELGLSLKGLWTRGRTVPDTDIFERYSIDVPAIAEKDIYASPPFDVVDGQLQYNYLYRQGEEMKDADGNVIYAHRKGDLVYEDGQPVVIGRRVGSREFDLLMVDGRHYFVNDSAYVAYNSEFVGNIVDWVMEDIPVLQARALEKTKIYYYPKNQLTRASLVVADYTEIQVNSEQSLVVDVYVTEEVYRSAQQREILRARTVAYLDPWISNPVISISDGIQGLKDIYGDVASAVMISGLGGAQNLKLVNIAKGEQRLCLKRILEVQQDGSYIIREDVTINFYKANPTPVA